MTTEAFDKGADFFKEQPELLAAAVWHVAAKDYADREAQREFVNGYIAARTRKDSQLAEWREEHNKPKPPKL